MRVVIPLWLLVSISVLAQLDGSSGVSETDEHIDPALESDNEIDVCSALYDAQQLLKDLQPHPHAHLERKLGGLSTFSSSSSKGWSEGLGWGHEGPLSTAFRLIPRVVNTIFLSPLSLLSRIPGSGYITSKPTDGADGRPVKKVKITKARRGKIERFWELVKEAEEDGCVDVHGLKARVRMFPPRGIKQDLTAAYASYEKLLEHKSDPEAQFMVGMYHSTGLGGVEEDQGKALLYYTFSALQGYKPAEMAMGYKHWAGIGVKEDCMTALDYYEGAADKAYSEFLSGPPGGKTLPLTTVRLSDTVGGIYGPHASWASMGANAMRPAVRASSASARGETEAEILEFYRYQSDRDQHVYTVRLGRLSYLGSVYPITGGSERGPGVSAGAEGVGEIVQSYPQAREYFRRVARVMWPGDFDAHGVPVQKKKLSKETEELISGPAMVAASFLGRMALRGEGQKVDHRLAKLWYDRAAELGDREAFNGLGIMYRDGLGVFKDPTKAYSLFQAAAEQDLAEAQVHLGKAHLGDIKMAYAYFESAIRHGSPFEAFHLAAKIYATTARLPQHAAEQRANCGVSVAYLKLVAERGAWWDNYVSEGDKAWARGETEIAMVRWLIAAEMGSEKGQNNVAFLLDGGIATDLFESRVDSMAMRQWIRSAAQDNVDAMVKVGDLYYMVNETLKSDPSASPLELAATYYQTAADTQTSAMAYWNLGWMYEMGKGVPRDWHLAKRYYDLSGETALEAWPAVIVSLTGLYLRSWWTEFWSRGEIPGLRLFEPSIEEDEDTILSQPSFWARLGSLFTLPPLEYDELEEYDDLSGSQWSGGGHAGVGGGEGELEDWEEDLAESVIIILVIVGIMGLVWLRQAWGRMEVARARSIEERRRREREDEEERARRAQRAGQELQGQGAEGTEGLQGGETFGRREPSEVRPQEERREEPFIGPGII